MLTLVRYITQSPETLNTIESTKPMDSSKPWTLYSKKILDNALAAYYIAYRVIRIALL
jgi:hypothetical protein